MYIYNVHHSCVAGTLTWELDTAAAVSVFMSKNSCNIITIKEEWQVAKTSGLGAGAFFLSSSLFFASPSFTPFFQFHKCLYKEIQPKRGVDLKHLLSGGSAFTFQICLPKMSKDLGIRALYWLQNPDVELFFAG